MRISQKLLFALVALCALAGVTATTALASGKPFVETKLATGVSFEGATLNGIVNPNGAETKYYFEYGGTTKYGKKTAEASAGSGTSNIEESKKLTEILIGAYHFRVVATNSNGTTKGEDETFGPPSAITLRAWHETGTGATLRGTVTPDNVEAKYLFEYGTEATKLTSKSAEATAGTGTSAIEVTKTISGLTEGKKYYYRILTKSTIGEVHGGIKEFVAAPGAEFSVASSFTGTFGESTFSIASGQVDYRSGQISGEMVNKGIMKNVTLKFFEGGNDTCNNGKAGELVWTGLTAAVGFVKSGEYGLVFEPIKQPLAACKGWLSGGSYEYGGRFVGVITGYPGSKEHTLTIREETNHLEDENAFPMKLGEGFWECPSKEGAREEECKFYAGDWSVGFDATMTLTFEKGTELLKS